MISNKTLSKLIAERRGRAGGQLCVNRMEDAQERRTARMQRLKAAVDARVMT